MEHPHWPRKVKWCGVFTGRMATLDLDGNLTYFTFRGRLGCLGKCLRQVEWCLSSKISQKVFGTKTFTEYIPELG